MSKSFESADRAFGPPPSPLRAVAAAALRAASRLLDRLARRLAQAPSRSASAAAGLPTVEFHADTEARDGALYVDGRLVGFLRGIRRL